MMFMKKLMLIILLFLVMCLNVGAKSSSKEIYFDDMTTKNFISKAGYLPLHSIKQICTYDFCDYIKSENVYAALDIFSKNYLKTIKDEEIRSSLNIKGIKITMVILN